MTRSASGAGREPAERQQAWHGRKSRWLLGAAGGILILLLIAIQVQQWRQTTRLRERAEQSYETRNRLDSVLSLQQDIETGQRGYILTGNPLFLEPYIEARARLPDELRQLRSDLAEPANQPKLRELERASSQKIAFSEHVVELGRQGRADEATELIATGRGREIMDRIRDLIDQLRRSERAELAMLLEARSSTRRWGQPFSLGVQLLLLLLLAGAYLLYLVNVRRLERTSRATQDLSARQQAVFDAATDAMLVVDDKGRIETANPSAQRLFARQAGDLVGRRLSAIFEGGDLFIGGLTDRRRTQRPEPTIQQVKGICADGSVFDAEVSSSVVQLAGGSVTLLLVRDSTERNRMERMKTEFVSTVSHELRTPLTSIRGALSILEHSIGETLDDKPRQLLGIAKSNSERLSHLIDDILDVEKLGSEALQFTLAPLDLRDVVARAADGNRTFAADREVRLVVSGPDEPLIVLGDESRLLQAITNLLSNAAKFSRKAGTVRLVAEREDGFARVTVADSGHGIPAEFRPRLFERFSQAPGSQQTGRSGTGLGLSITKSIVERHNGTIDYRTETGKGTSFWIELPLAPQE